MYDFAQIARNLENVTVDFVRKTNSRLEKSYLIYDPVIGDNWLKTLIRNGDKKNKFGLMMNFVTALREKNKDEVLPAPVVLQAHMTGIVLRATMSTKTFYCDFLRNEVCFRDSIYLSDRDLVSDYSVDSYLNHLDDDEESNWGNISIPRYAQQDGDALYEDTGYTDLIVPIVGSKIINV